MNARSPGPWLAALAGTAALVVWALLGSPRPVDPATRGQGQSPADAAAKLAQQPAVSPPAPVAPASAAGMDDTPPGMSRAQWAAVRAEMRGRADGPAELRRLGAYLSWSDTLRRFREARQHGADAVVSRSLAESVDQGLAARMREGEVSAAEARQIKSAALETTQPDETVRAQQLQQWAATAFATAAPDPRQAAFAQRQNEIVAAWSNQPAAARDRAALERQLDALRQQSFSAAAR